MSIRVRGSAAALFGALAAVCLAAAPAGAANRVYWSDGGAGTIRVGNLDGSGPAASLFSGETRPEGVAIDPAAGKIYWADYVKGGSIRVANLDGSGSPSNLFSGEEFPAGVTIDPSAGKIYWTDDGETVRVGNLDGSGSPATLFGSELAPWGIAIDPAAGKLYWGVYGTPAAIRTGNLDGSGSAGNLFGGQAIPRALAIEPAAGKMYWGAFGSGEVRVGNLDGSGSYASLFASESSPDAVALDPTAGKIYWTDDSSSGAIRVGNLDGSGSAANLGSFTGEEYPGFLALLRAPQGTGAPQITGASSIGSVLSCSLGSWAPDLPGAFLFRAARSARFQWSVNGGDIAGASASTYAASAPGSYTCRQIATNEAGSSAQTSAPHAIVAGPPVIVATIARISALGETNPTFTVARASTPLTGLTASAHKRGTVFSFGLDQPATVTIAIGQRAGGRLVGHTCRSATPALGHRPRCTRTITIATLSRTAHAGLNRVAFSGRVAARALRPGRYQAGFTATDSAGASPTASLLFTIAKR